MCVEMLCRLVFIEILVCYFHVHKVGGNGGARRRSGNPGRDCRRKGKICIVFVLVKLGIVWI